MKLLIPAALVNLVIVSPAYATGGLICRTAGGRPVEAAITISHTVVPSVVSARLRDGNRNVQVRVAQSWLDARELRLDLVDATALRHELRLRVKGDGRTYDGTLWRRGQHWWVRCRESG